MAKTNPLCMKCRVNTLQIMTVMTQIESLLMKMTILMRAMEKTTTADITKVIGPCKILTQMMNGGEAGKREEQSREWTAMTVSMKKKPLVATMPNIIIHQIHRLME